MTDALPILLLLAFGALAAWLGRHRHRLAPWMVSVFALAAAVFLLIDAINDPPRRAAGLLFAFLGLVFAWRARSTRAST